ncbi:Meteorin-like protein, partial [Blattella germanica]
KREDCVSNGLSTTASDGPGRGVTPVYLRCSQGHLEWVYPRGALRVLLRLGASGRDFRGCVKVGLNFGGARIFLEGPRSLVPLFAAEDGAPHQLVRCFHSRGGQAALYVEAATSKTDFTKQVASLTYDLEALPRGGSAYDPSEECRPCTEEEMAHAFCTSDLVTRGIIRGIENKDELEVAQVTVKVTKLLRQSIEDNVSMITQPDDDSNNLVIDDSEGQVLVNVARHCGARHGTGEFVFMARKKLGDLSLSCAPRLEDWATVVRKINKEGTAHCVLKS